MMKLNRRTGGFARQNTLPLPDADGFVIRDDVLVGYLGDAEEVTVPEGIRVIDAVAFCRGGETPLRLRSLHLPSTLREIRRCAFGGCRHLETVTMPQGVAVIGEMAFYDCRSLRELQLPQELRYLGKAAFTNTQLRHAEIPPHLQAVPDYAFAGCKHLKTVSFGSRLRSIGHGAFRSCTALRSAALPSSVETVGENAFCGCTKLEKIVLSRKTALAPSALFAIPVLRLYTDQPHYPRLAVQNA